VKIGFVSTFSGPTAVIGNDMRNSVELALDHLGRKMGACRSEVVYEDDQQKPEVASRRPRSSSSPTRSHSSPATSGRNVLLASLKPAVDSQTFLDPAPNAAPRQIAGECARLLLSRPPGRTTRRREADGRIHEPEGVKSVFLIGQTCAGKDMLTGGRATFKGRIIGEET